MQNIALHQTKNKHNPSNNENKSAEVIPFTRPVSNLAGKLAEIDRRYSREKKRDRSYHRCSELNILIKHLIKNGASEDDVRPIRECISDGGCPSEKAAELGKRLKFTSEQYKAIGQARADHFRTITPFDISMKDRLDYLTGWQRPRKKARLRIKRHNDRISRDAALAWARDLDCKQSAIATVLQSGKPQTIKQLAKTLDGYLAFEAVRDRSMPAVINRELKRMEKSGMVVLDRRVSRDGCRVEIVAALKDCNE
jgi:hypothetical protein